VGDVVLTAANVHLEREGELDTAVTGRAQPHHALAECDHVEVALVGRFRGDGHLITFRAGFRGPPAPGR
jgi:hypothetical protein